MRRNKSVDYLSVEKSTSSRSGVNIQKKVSNWSIKSPSNPKAMLFEVNGERTAAAYGKLNDLANDTSVANPDALNNLREHRSSEFFLKLQEKIKRHEKLVLSEYMYYALTTNDVNKLQIDLLEALKIHRDHHGFLPNIEVLIALRNWQSEKDELKKEKLNEKLLHELNTRGYATGYRHAHCKNILNLHGANLAGAKLHFASLDYSDLENADLSNCVLQNIQMSYSCLNRVNFSNSSSKNSSKQNFQYCMNLNNSEVKEANFSNFKATEFSAINADFTGSVFQHAEIILYPLRDTDINQPTIFDFVNFSNAKITFNHDSSDIEYSIQNAILHQAAISGINHTNINFTNSMFLRFTEFYSTDTVKKELDSVYNSIFLAIFNEFNKFFTQTAGNKRIENAQQMVAAAFIYQMNYLHLHKNEKEEFLKLALQHDIFTIQQRSASYYARTMNFLSIIPGTLFGSTLVAANPGIKLLQAELDKLTKTALSPSIST